MSTSFLLAATQRVHDARWSEARSFAPEMGSTLASDAVCFICLESGEEAVLLPTGCGCRGTAGHVHERCAIQGALATQARNGTWAGKQHPWQLCQTCRLPYTGSLKLALAQAWSRRTDGLSDSDPAQYMAARTALGNALSAEGRLEEAEGVVRDNLARARALYGTGHRMAMGIRFNLGLVLDGQGKSEEAAHVYTELNTEQQRVLGPEHPDTLMSAMQIANSDLNAGRNEEAATKYRRVLDVQRRVLGAAHPITLTCGMNLASTLLSLADYQEAETLYRANLAAKLRTLGAEHVDTLMVSMNLGVVFKERGRYEEAGRWLRANLDTKRRVLGRRHMDTCFSALNLCGVWLDGRHAAKLTEADSLARLSEADCLAAETRSALACDFGEMHPSTLTASMYVGAALHARGQPTRAAKVLRRVHEAQTAAHGERHPDAVETAWRLGSALADVGTAEALEAAALLRATAAHLEAQLGSDHPRTLRAFVGLGAALLAAGGDADATEAASLLARCKAAQHTALPPGHADLHRTRALLARTNSNDTAERHRQTSSQ